MISANAPHAAAYSRDESTLDSAAAPLSSDGFAGRFLLYVEKLSHTVGGARMSPCLQITANSALSQVTAVMKGGRMMIKKSVGVVSLAALVGLGTLTMAAHAQNAPSADDSSQTAQNAGDDMVARVKQALHSQPALNDKHIDVSMKNGKVVMRGFVNSQGDLQKALRAADKTAGSKNVVDELKIQRDDDLNPTSG